MNAAALLELAERAGVRLWRDGDRLRYSGKPEAVAVLLPSFKASKTELLALLAANDGDAAPVVSDPIPASLAIVAASACLWLRPGDRPRYMVTGPDHDLREQYADAVPLFDDAHRKRVRRNEPPTAAPASDDKAWKRELRALLEAVYPDDDGAICEELCRAESDPDGALRAYREIEAKERTGSPWQSNLNPTL